MAQITLRDYLQETEDAIGAQQIEKALASCQTILARFPDSLEGQRLLGEVYLAQGRLEEAQHAFDWVLSHDPESVITYCSRALVSERLSDYDTALDCYQQAYELSRGNSQIRRAFNELSERVGQQGFMLSRAGLARLYMRGDLLAQAIQEWDVVLAATPDRLDARTGLLEAYWREGFHDRAAQMANQILRDVPGCLKALILLAHVTAPQDMLQSQELIQRVEALDPDLVMAHELFADHIASQSRDPFLKLLKKPPIVIDEDVARLETMKDTAAVTVGKLAAQAQNGTHTPSFAPSSDLLASWGSEQTLVEPHTAEADAQLAPAPAAWNADTGVGNYATIDTWQQPGTSTSDAQWNIDDATAYSVPWSAFQSDVQAELPSGENGRPEPWQLLQNTINNIRPEVTWDQPQQELPAIEVAPLPKDDAPGVQMPQNARPVEEEQTHIFNQGFAADLQAFPLQQDSDPLAPPAWLNMLTQDERNQLSGVMPVVRPAEASEPEQPPVPVPTPPPASQAESPPENVAVWSPQQNLDTKADADDAGEEESFFGPDWLKSLGAEALDDESTEQPAPVAPSPAQMPADMTEPVRMQEEVYETWQSQAEQSQSDRVEQSWMASSLQKEQEERPARASWLDSLGTSSIYEQREPASQSWEASLNAGIQSEEYQQQQEAWRESQYDSYGQPNGISQPSVYSEREAEPEGILGGWSEQSAQPQAQPERGSWLDALSSLPEFEVRERQQPMPSFWGDEPAVEAQPQNEQAMAGQEKSEEDWSSPWVQLERAQPAWRSQTSETQTSETQTSSMDELWPPLPPVSPEPQPQADEKSEQNLVSTLEELEQSLRSRGFVPLEPNSLSAIAQTQATPPATNEYTQVPQAQTIINDSASQENRPEPSLSSALAELGNFAQPAASHERETAELARAETFEQPEAEPSWLASLRSVPAPASPEIEAPKGARQEMPAAEHVPIHQMQEAQQEPSLAFPASAEMASSPSFEATRPGTVNRQPDVLQEAAVRMNPLLDSELETTMKRPAVRLQPLQKRALPARDPMPQSRNRAPEQGTGTSGNGNAGHRERLVRGYQAQLIGDYDSAMQEYRVIIRNAPELLGEVVSNVRALLKLAPRYAAGYRVLGDAYMRQGEYLQAMEAYNKALTMAKKAKN